MSLLRPRRRDDDDAFDAERPERELEARKRNWRPYIVFGGAGVLMAAVIWLEPYAWWEKKEKEARKPVVEPAFDVGSLRGFRHPDPAPVPPVIQEVAVERMVEVPVDRTEYVQLPPPPQERRDLEIEKVRITGNMGWKPEGETQQAAYMLDGTRPVAAWGCALRPGMSIIHATLNDDVRWEHGGPVSATVTEDVMSPEAFARGERRVLIPAGAQLVGIAGTDRLDQSMDLAPAPLWTEVSFVDTVGMPRSINLYDAQGAGPSGINAIGGTVDSRWGDIVKAAALFTVLDVLGGININLGDRQAVGVRISGNTAASIGEQVVGRMLDWKPRIFTEKGTQIIVKPQRAIKVCAS